MCDFKPGDEVVCVDAVFHGTGSLRDALLLIEGAHYTISASMMNGFSVHVAEIEAENPWGFKAVRFRKVQKRNDRLTIESFSVIKDGGFEEPKRAPARKAVDA